MSCDSDCAKGKCPLRRTSRRSPPFSCSHSVFWHLQSRVSFCRRGPFDENMGPKVCRFQPFFHLYCCDNQVWLPSRCEHFADVRKQIQDTACVPCCHLFICPPIVPVENGTSKEDSDEPQLKYDYCEWSSDCDYDEYCDYDNQCKDLDDWYYEK